MNIKVKVSMLRQCSENSCHFKPEYLNFQHRIYIYMHIYSMLKVEIFAFRDRKAIRMLEISCVCRHWHTFTFTLANFSIAIAAEVAERRNKLADKLDAADRAASVSSFPVISIPRR